MRWIALLLSLLFVPAASAYRWELLTPEAAFPKSYNYPVHVAPDGRFVALHPQGTWTSQDGKSWSRAALPFNGLNSAYLAYLQHNGAAWSFGKLNGNYLGFSIDPVVERTEDYGRWRRVGVSASLPKVVFYAAASFDNAMWILGGYDGHTGTKGVWRSQDGLNWTRLPDAPWSARSGSKAATFGNRLYLIGGGVVDGPNANDVWSTADGQTWRLETASIAPEAPVGYTPIVFDGKIWLVGANRSGTFASGMLVSGDGKHWDTVDAPWTPRGGVAAWTDGHAMFITGGKYSTVIRGETVFSYSNDVWRMSR